MISIGDGSNKYFYVFMKLRVVNSNIISFVNENGERFREKWGYWEGNFDFW